MLGVELAEKAVTGFFAEQGSQPEIRDEGALVRYSAGGVEILLGDFFALDAREVAECTGLYDRAALIALPPEMRATRRIWVRFFRLAAKG